MKKKIFRILTIGFILAILVASFLPLSGALAVTRNLYWVGGTGQWSDTAHWSLASGGAGGEAVPDSDDNVIFDAGSDTGSNFIVYQNAVIAYCNNFTVSGTDKTMDIWGTAGESLRIYGDMTLQTGMIYRVFDTYFYGPGAQSITSNGVPFVSLYLKGTGTVTLQDDLSCTYVGYYHVTVENGTLNTNGKTLTCGSIESSFANVRAITFGSSTINIEGSGHDFDCTTATNLTLNFGSATINIADAFIMGTPTSLTCGTSVINVGGSFTGGSQTYNVVNSTGATATIAGNNTITTLNSSGASVTLSGNNTITTGTFTGGSVTLSGTNSFGTLNITGTAALNNTVSLGGNQTITGTLNINGNSQTNRILVKSGTLGTARTITAANVSVSNLDFLDITGAGAGDWDLSSITGGSGDLGGNTNITFTTPTTRYWIDNAGNYSDRTHWSASSGGGSGATMPLVQDTAIFDANSFTVDSRTVTVDVPYIGNVNSVSVIHSPTISSTTTINVYQADTFTLGTHGWSATTGTYIYDRTQPFLNTGATTLTGDLYIYANGTTCTLLNDLVITGTLYHRAGTFDALTSDITAAYFDSSTTTYTRVLSLGTGTHTFNGAGAVTKWNLSATNNTVQANTATIILTNATANGQTFAGGTGITTYNILRIEGDGNYTLTFSSSNTYNKVIIDRSVASKTIAGNYTLTCTGGFFVPLAGTRTVTITNVDFTKASGVVSSDYLILSGSAAGGGATYNAGAHATDNGGNSGWIFGSLAEPAITTIDATVVTNNGATLNAEVTSMGGYSTIDVGFEYGKTVSYGTYTAFQTGITGIGDATGRRITALQSNTTYHFRAIIRYNEADYVYGDDETFTTEISESGVATTGVPLVTTVPGAIPNMYDEGETGGLFGLSPLVNPALAAVDIPEAFLWYPIAFAVAIALGFAAYAWTRQLLVQAVVSGVVMAAFCGGGVLGDGLLPYWTVFIFIVEAIMLMIIQEKVNA